MTTRFASRPNLQNFPKRADKVDEEDEWRAELPPDCAESFKTRNVLIAKPGCVFVSLDLTPPNRDTWRCCSSAPGTPERDYWTRRDDGP